MYIKSNDNPSAQVVKRVYELEEINMNARKKEIKTRINANNKNRWFLMSNGNCTCIKKIQGSDLFCGKIKSNRTKGFYEIPCEPKRLGIVYDNNSIRIQKWITLSQLKGKVICLPYRNSFVLVAPLNDVYWCHKQRSLLF